MKKEHILLIITMRKKAYFPQISSIVNTQREKNSLIGDLELEICIITITLVITEKNYPLLCDGTNIWGRIITLKTAKLYRL